MAVKGICNGVIFGLALWLVGILAFRLIFF